MSAKTKNSNPSELSVSRALNVLLEGSYFPSSLQPNSAHSRRHDDTDGETGLEQDLTVAISQDCDAWIVAGGGKTLRFRNWFGGGMSLRTRNALLVLAEAIRRDAEERPQD